jgi:TatA/E family protein of Tat protein translocase
MQLAEIASVEVIMILAAVGLLVFGSAKLPRIARGLGSAKSQFEQGLKDVGTAVAVSTPTASTPTASTPTASTPTASTPTASMPTASTEG